MPSQAPTPIDWDALGTLHNTIGGYEIRTDPLWLMLITAMQGHEGSVDDMLIVMADGTRYGPDDLRALAVRSDRPRR